jgi:hypothetical protein
MDIKEIISTLKHYGDEFDDAECNGLYVSDYDKGKAFAYHRIYVWLDEISESEDAIAERIANRLSLLADSDRERGSAEYPQGLFREALRIVNEEREDLVNV